MTTFPPIPHSGRPMPRLPVGMCWGTIIQADLPTLIEVSAAHGFPTITVPPAKYNAIIEYGVTPNALRRQAADAGIKVTMIDQVSAGLPGLVTGHRPGMPPTHQTGNGLDQCCAMAEALDCNVINITHYTGDPDTPLVQIAEALDKMCDLATARGFAMTFEFIPNTAVGSIATAAALRDMIGLSRLHLVVDVWHLANSGGGVTDIEALPKGSFAAIQLSDRAPIDPTQPPPVGMSRSMPGEGVLPLGDVISAVFRNSPDAAIEVEVFDPDLRDLSPSAAAARAAAATSAWLNRYPHALPHLARQG